MKLAVGFFDGIHLGHRRILADADAVLTFRNHPTTILAPAHAPALLMTSATRLATLSQLLAEHQSPITVLDFTKELASQPAAEFADWLRMTYPSLETIYCGDNWTFGAGGAGTPDFLRARGFNVDVAPYAEYEGNPVSSTRIRKALAAGDCESAAAMLGRPWQMEGTVAGGKGVGRKLGFPTINVCPAAELVNPPCGVYAVDTPFGRGIANYGFAPTMGDDAWSSPVLEVNVFADDVRVVPGAEMFVSLLRFLRAERTFDSVGELKAQIVRDVELCKSI